MIERKIFTGGMNIDDAVEFVPRGDYLILENARIHKEAGGETFAVKPAPSTTLRWAPVKPGTQKRIGSIADEDKQRVYWFLWSGDTGDHHIIYAWDRQTETTYEVLKSDQVNGGLNFTEDSLVNGVALIDDYLYWTDNRGEPRKINVERGIKTNHPSYISQDGIMPEPYDSVLEQHDITVARRMPYLAPLITKIVSADDAAVVDRTTNLIDGDSFQFAYRYTYRSGERSVFSMYSKVAPHNRSTESYDTIKVELPKGENIDYEVRLIEFLVKKGSTKSWAVIKTFNRDTDETAFNNHNSVSSSALSFYFYNDNAGTAVADSEAGIFFHDVPVYSKALEVAGNRLFLANNVKGYDYPSGMDITLTTETQSGNITGTYYLIGITCAGVTTHYVVILVPATYGDIQGWYQTSYTKSQFDSNALPASVTLSLSDRYPIPDLTIPPLALVAHISSCGSGYSAYTFTEYVFAQPTISGLGTWFDKTRVFRSGKTYKVHALFFDYTGRNAGVMHDPEEVVIPAGTYEQTVFTTGINWLLQNDPSFIPMWATHFAIARTKVTETFIANYTDSILYGNQQTDGTYNFTDNTYSNQDAIGLDIKTVVEAGMGYTYTTGDVVKIINSGGTEYFLQVIGQQGDYVILKPKNIGDTTGATFYFEISTTVSDSDLYWEVGDTFRVLNPGTSSRTLEMNTGTLTGDTFLTQRTLGSTPRTVEVMNPNDEYWTIWPQDTGRSNAVVNSKQKRLETEFAWSLALLRDTEINDLNVFLAANVKNLDEGIGPVQKLVFTSRTAEYGTVMLVLGSTEVASIYLGRTEMFDSTEGSQILSTGDVVGSINILRGGYGTLHPESVVERNGSAYWFSAIKSAFVRYNLNGTISINNKIGSYAKLIANEVLGNSTHLKIFGGFDDFRSQFLVAIPALSREFPTVYPVLEDIFTTVGTTTIDPKSDIVFPVNLTAGKLYKVSISFTGTAALTVTGISDLWYGTSQYVDSGLNSYDFQFWASYTGDYDLRFESDSSSDFTVTVIEQQLNPYVLDNEVPKVLCFNEDNDRWENILTIAPDGFDKLGDLLLSWKDGNLYSHDGTVFGSFYGITRPSGVAMLVNANPNFLKKYQTVSVEGNAPDWIHLRTEEPYTQSTDIYKNELDTKEGVFHGYFKQDRLSPNGSGDYEDKMNNGDDMRARVAKVYFKYDNDFLLKFVSINHRVSSGHPV